MGNSSPSPRNAGPSPSSQSPPPYRVLPPYLDEEASVTGLESPNPRLPQPPPPPRKTAEELRALALRNDREAEMNRAQALLNGHSAEDLRFQTLQNDINATSALREKHDEQLRWWALLFLLFFFSALGLALLWITFRRVWK